MVNTGFIICADQAGVTTTAATSQMLHIAGTMVLGTTESAFQVIIRNPGTFHSMSVKVRTNTATGTNTMTFRKNAAAGNETVNMAGATGIFTDTTNVDAISATDKVNYNSSADTTLVTTYGLLSILFDSTTNFATRQEITSSKAFTSTTCFNTFNGRISTTATTEGNVATTIQKTGVFKFLTCEVSANAKTATQTVTSRKNSGAGGMTLTIGSGTTGFFEDTTNSDSVTGGTDTWDSSIPAGSDITHSTTFQHIAVDFTTSSGNIFAVQCSLSDGIATTASTTQFLPIGGRLAFITTEANIQSKALANFTYQDLSCHQVVTATNTSTLTFRKNTANGNQTITVGTAAGTSTDTTHIDTVASSDLVNTQIVSGASTQPTFSNITVYGSFVASIAQTVFVEWEEA